MSRPKDQVITFNEAILMSIIGEEKYKELKSAVDRRFRKFYSNPIFQSTIYPDDARNELLKNSWSNVLGSAGLDSETILADVEALEIKRRAEEDRKTRPQASGIEAIEARVLSAGRGRGAPRGS